MMERDPGQLDAYLPAIAVLPVLTYTHGDRFATLDAGLGPEAYAAGLGPEAYEADRKRRLGTDADQPHRIKYKPLPR